MAIITEIRALPEGEELHDVDHDVWIASEAARMGFPIAGFLREIYEDAVILLPGSFKFDWKPDKVKMGRVLHIRNKTRHTLDYEGEDYTYSQVEFVLLTPDGTQVPLCWGDSHQVFFALPEDSETAFRFETV